MSSCRLLLAAGTSAGSKLDGWRLSQPYEVFKFNVDDSVVMIHLSDMENIIKFSNEDLYTILTCSHSFIVTFRFNPGFWSKIGGTCHLSPPFDFDVSENFDITVSSQSQNFEKLRVFAGRKGAKHPKAMSIYLMKHFPLEDQGMVLIYGPLPNGAMSYPAEKVFHIDKKYKPEISDQIGLGLLFKVREGLVYVQYEDGVHTLDRSTISSSYKVYSTGIPTPVEAPGDGESRKIV
jgi:hypothetical protein